MIDFETYEANIPHTHSPIKKTNFLGSRGGRHLLSIGFMIASEFAYFMIGMTIVLLAFVLLLLLSFLLLTTLHITHRGQPIS